MSLETKANVEYHAMSVAIGLSGLRILQDFGKSTAELDQFKNYLAETKKFTTPPHAREIEAPLNNTLKILKEHVEKNNLRVAIEAGERIYNHLFLIHEKI